MNSTLDRDTTPAGMVNSNDDPLAKARLRGRRAGIVVFGVIVAAFTAVCAGQIIHQVWYAPAPRIAELNCNRGALGLIKAVRRAREAAASETGGEHQALARFRSELKPEWFQRRTLGAQCRSNTAVRRALEEIDRLRYAEEHAVRYEAVDLARRRRRVLALETELLTEREPIDPTRKTP